MGARVKRVYPFVVLVLVSLLVGAAAVLWSAHDVSVNDRKWCALVSTIDQANAAAPRRPPAGTFTAQFIAEIHSLRGELGCP